MGQKPDFVTLSYENVPILFFSAPCASATGIVWNHIDSRAGYGVKWLLFAEKQQNIPA